MNQRVVSRQPNYFPHPRRQVIPRPLIPNPFVPAVRIDNSGWEPVAANPQIKANTESIGAMADSLNEILDRIREAEAATGRDGKDAEIDYNKLATMIIGRMKADASFRGAKGATGDTGNNGSNGENPTLDYNKLVAEIIKRLPPVRMEIQHLDGSVKFQEKPLGEVIAIKLVPKKSN